MRKRDFSGRRELSPRFSLALLMGAFSLILFPALLLRVKVQPLFLLAWTLAAVGCLWKGWSMDELQAGTADYCRRAVGPSLIMLGSGAMMGVWNACGTIPMLTVLGTSVLRADFFLPAAFLFSFLFSLLMGTIFGYCGTIGVVLMTIGQGLGLPAAVCAGAVVSGSFVGYVSSPLADCTNAASPLAGISVGDILHSELWLTAPGAAAGTLYYWILNRTMTIQASAAGQTAAGAETIGAFIKTGPVTALPVLTVVILLLLKQPTILSIMAGVLSGMALALFYQGEPLNQVMQSVWSGPDWSAAGEWTQEMFGRGGMQSMNDTVILIVLAFGLFGLLETCGAMRAVMDPVLRGVNQKWKAGVVTAVFGLLANLLSASAMCSLIFTLSCMAPVYEKNSWPREELIRASVTGCLYASLMIPWHSNVVTPAALLGLEPGAVCAQMRIPLLISAIWLIVQFRPDRGKRGRVSYSRA